MKYLIFYLLSFFIIVDQASGEFLNTTDHRCLQDSIISSYNNLERGKVYIYLVPETYKITVTDISCVIGYKFLDMVDQLPNRFVIGIMSKDFKQAHIIQWDLNKNIFITLDVSGVDITGPYNGIFTIYPEPLKRIKDIFINNKFPQKEQISIEYRKIFKQNYINASYVDLWKIALGKQ